MRTTLSLVAVRQRTLLHVFPSFGIGGVPVRVAQMANWFGKKYEHQIIALDGDFDCCERLDDAVDYQRVPFTSANRSMLANLLSFRQQLEALAPDVLVTYNWGAVELALSNSFQTRKHIHVEDGFGPEEAERQFRRRVLFRRYVLARSDKVVVPSKSLYDIAIKTWRLAPQKVQYLPNGIDCQRFHRSPDRGLLSRLGITPATPVIGTVAALRTEKNLARLIRSFALVLQQVPAKLVIAGDGPERPAMTHLAAEMGLADSVVFAGHVPEPESLLGAFDVFALSSDTEQMPYSILEAMAAALPVASVDVGDIRNMVCVENQDCIVARDDAALAAAIVNLLRDEGLRWRLGELNREKAECQYDQRLMLAEYDKLFSS